MNIENNNTEYVWYVCYGSNLLFDRFMCYLTGNSLPKYGVSAGEACANANPPIKTMVVAIPYALYFARQSKTWHGGVAFLDPLTPSYTIGRAYLITKEQYEHVKRREGSWYRKEIRLPDIDGYQSLTFTDMEVAEPVKPSIDYQNVIIEGLMETGISKGVAEAYIKEAIKRIPRRPSN